MKSSSELATFLVENRIVHRRSAQRGLLQLAADTMESFSSVQQVANLNKELDFMPPPEILPEDFESAIQKLVAISQDVKLAFHEPNTTNQQRQYNRINQSIIDFRKKSNASRLPTYVQFRQVSGIWLQIIQREIRRLEQLHGNPLPNPFITGNPILPQDKGLFVGRSDIIEEIQTQALREGSAGAILFMGSRRTGKSSTLLNLNRFLPSTLQAVYFDCQSPKIQTRLPEFCKHISQEIIIKLPALRQEAFPQDLVALTDFLEDAEKALKTEKKHILLCMDEYERLGALIKDGSHRGLADALRSWIQRFRCLTFLFAGSHELVEVSNVDWTDYLINVRTVYISYLDEPSAHRLVTKPVPEFNLRYLPDTLPRQLIQHLGCQPYLVQCAMSEMVESLNHDGNRKIASQLDIDHAIKKMFTTAQQYFEHFWEKELDESSRQVLFRLAKGKPIESETSATKRLVKKEVLRRVNGQLEFCVPVLREWIERYC